MIYLKPLSKDFKVPELKKSLDIKKFSLEEVNEILKHVNYRMFNESPEKYVGGKKLKHWNNEVIEELSIKHYERRLESKTFQLLTPGCGIPRFKMDKMMEKTSKAMDELTKSKGDKFNTIRTLIK